MAEKFCPVCKYKNDDKATVCAYCGAPLGAGDENPTTTRKVEDGTSPLSQLDREILQRTFQAPTKGINIYIENQAKPIEIEGAIEIILGRKMTGEINTTFIDLKPYGAYENGVSRRHALIRKTSTGYEIVDLNSTNGTWLEQKRLVPDVPYPLDNGSRIRLGRLVLILAFTKTTSG